ncbi:MAG: UDP-N-acetylmuramoyl-L-alanine--D-glutamate ligase [Armatimonadetes bacterium]|nr:UDP-N-acetylmuramoyl-L-alanine--D-glutamate ligase [Armatimonadota bacterium]
MSGFSGRTIAIIGAAATGRAAAPVLARRGARVVVYDAKSKAELGDAVTCLRTAGIDLHLGDPDYPGIEAADLVIPSPGVRADAPVLLAARARGVPVLSEIEIAYRLSRAPIIGITGTNGKTTTVLMTAAALRQAGFDVLVAGNTLAGGFQVPLIQAADQARPEQWLVAEISSFQLEWVQCFAPRVAVITNITQDHLDRHGTPETYVAAKARLLDAQGPDDWAVLNADNATTAALAPQVRSRRLWFTRSHVPDQGGWVERRIPTLSGWLRLCVAGEVEDLMPASALRMPGEHTVENALAAACAARAAGAPAAAIARALAAFSGVPDRLEYVATLRGVDYVNNSMCTNVDAAVRSIRAYDRPLIVIAGGRDKGSDFAPLGEALAERARALVTIGEHGGRIAAAARAAGLIQIESARSMEEAVRTAAALAWPGDVVLLAPGCASFDWFRGFEHRGQAFREAVAALAQG